MTTPQPPAAPQLPPHSIALIIDGLVADVLHTDDRLAAILLSEPTIVEVTELVRSNPQTSYINATYDGKEFTPTRTWTPPTPQA